METGQEQEALRVRGPAPRQFPSQSADSELAGTPCLGTAPLSALGSILAPMIVLRRIGNSVASWLTFRPRYFARLYKECVYSML
jgi:hypothetical protein